MGTWPIAHGWHAIGTALPLAILPFDPEQTLEHYAVSCTG